MLRTPSLTLVALLASLALALPSGCLPSTGGPYGDDDGYGGDDDDDDNSDDDDATSDDDATADDDTTVDDDTTASDDDTTLPPDDDTAVGDDPPEILSLTANKSQITEGESVEFTALVTDPQGTADIVGGILETPSGDAYATFTGSGSYTVTVYWSAFHGVDSIDFDDEEVRAIRARFFDVAGNTALDSITLRLHCGGDAACEGECTEVMGDDPLNCGACGRVCESCMAGACFEYTCVATAPWMENCDDACSSEGLDCSDWACGKPTGIAFFETSTCNPSAEQDYLYECAYGTDHGATGSMSCCCGGS